MYIRIVSNSFKQQANIANSTYLPFNYFITVFHLDSTAVYVDIRVDSELYPTTYPYEMLYAVPWTWCIKLRISIGA